MTAIVYIFQSGSACKVGKAMVSFSDGKPTTAQRLKDYRKRCKAAGKPEPVLVAQYAAPGYNETFAELSAHRWLLRRFGHAVGWPGYETFACKPAWAIYAVERGVRMAERLERRYGRWRRDAWDVSGKRAWLIPRIGDVAA